MTPLDEREDKEESDFFIKAESGDKSWYLRADEKDGNIQISLTDNKEEATTLKFI
jgi:hypothetical protein